MLLSLLSTHCRLEPKSLWAGVQRESCVDESQHPSSRWQNPAARHTARQLHQSPRAIRLRGHAGTQGTPFPGREPDDGKDSDRRAASRWRNRHEPPFPVSGKRQTGANVFACQIRKVFENVLFTHPGGKVFQYIVHGHTKTTNAGFTATLLRINCNEVFPIHMVQSSLGIRKDQGCNRKSAHIPFLPHVRGSPSQYSGEMRQLSAHNMHHPHALLDNYRAALLRWKIPNL